MKELNNLKNDMSSSEKNPPNFSQTQNFSPLKRGIEGDGKEEKSKSSIPVWCTKNENNLENVEIKNSNILNVEEGFKPSLTENGNLGNDFSYSKEKQKESNEFRPAFTKVYKKFFSKLKQKLLKGEENLNYSEKGNFLQILKKNPIIQISSFLIFTFFILFTLQSLLSQLDNNFRDFTYRIRSNSDFSINSNVDNRIGIIAIDDKTLQNFEYPLDRKRYAEFIEKFFENTNGSFLAFDIGFMDSTNPESDEALKNSLIKYKDKIILGNFESSEIGKFQDFFPLLKDENAFEKSFFSIKPNSENNVVYKIKAEENYNGNIIKSFTLETFNKYSGGNVLIKRIKGNETFLGNIPLDKDGNFNIGFLNFNKFFDKTYSFFDLYSSNDFYKNNSLDQKIFFVGVTAKGTKDIFNTPFGEQYGVYLHAQALNSVFQISLIPKESSKSFEIFLLGIFLLLTILVNTREKYLNIIFGNILLIFFALFTIFFTVYVTSYLLQIPSYFLFGFIISAFISNIFKYLIEYSDKQALSTALSEYVSKEVADQVIGGKASVNFEGEEKYLSIFFSDIEGFTTISENMNPQDLVKFLRSYLSLMSNCILDNKGFINKYEGDAIFALWGVFGELDNPTLYNCLAALEQQKALKSLNEKNILIGFPAINVRMGIHAGESIVGNIGVKGRKMEFTALGDSINLGSRLEGINKAYHTNICISENAKISVEKYFEFRYLDEIKVKGKNNSVKIYELLGKKGEVEEKIILIRNGFEKAIGFYFEYEFEKALEIFRKLFVAGDRTSSVYMTRCEFYIDNPPNKEEGLIWKFETK